MPEAQELFQQALECLDKEAFKEALQLLGEAAREEYGPAQYRLGLMYANAEGVSLNYRNAAEWIEKAARQNIVPAQSLLAWLYAGGYGLEQNDTAAGEWYLRAARQGSPKDQYTAATMYRWGRFGVAVDKAQMLEWYQRSANQGFAPAQLALGKLLAAGKHIETDLVTAYQWLSLALANGSEQAGKTLQDISKRMSPEQIEEAQQQMFAAAGTDRDAILQDSSQHLL